ncbi:hypothetical protein QYE76_033311 [Lolium multiflorum]|uniref:Uncharacterized protein n=1 Tax=Lolium multiflorum TaxID=4521 RepID=A0AAD8QV75_LOLMU|nr:hypothetical protein QYE76_033311 [Lolium multiflorum]
MIPASTGALCIPASTGALLIPNTTASPLISVSIETKRFIIHTFRPGIGQVARPAICIARDQEALRAVALRDGASRSPSCSGSTVLTSHCPPVGFDINTFSTVGPSSTSTTSPSTSEMAESIPVKYEDLADKLGRSITSHTTDVAATAKTIKEIIGLMRTGGIVRTTATTTGTNVAPEEVEEPDNVDRHGTAFFDTAGIPE